MKAKTEKPKERQIKSRGRTFVGTVISAKAAKTVSVEWDRVKKIQKYERLTKARTRVKAHNPPEINAKESDVVMIKECRPLSKTKKFIITKVLGKDKDHVLEKAELEIEQEKQETEKKEVKKPVEKTQQTKKVEEEKSAEKKVKENKAEPKKKETKKPEPDKGENK